MPLRLPYEKLSSASYGRLIALEKSIDSSTLGRLLVDLVCLRVSQMNGCLFCADIHIKEARLHGERELRLHQVGFWRESSLFDPRERAALEWAEAVTRLGREGVPGLLFEAVSQVLEPKELSDLTFWVSLTNFWNRLGLAFLPVPGSKDALLGLDHLGLA